MGEDEKKKQEKSAALKHMLENNPYDKYFAWRTKKLKKLGLLEIADSAVYWNGWRTFRALFKFLWGYKIHGAENFPEYGPAIAISNHQSEYDPYLVGSSVHRKVRWISKKENFDIPIYKSIIQPFGTIPIKRGGSDREALKALKSVLENGEVIGMFPEGTRSPDGKLMPFHKGPALFCMECGVPYVPFALLGAYRILPKTESFTKTKAFGDYKVSVYVGKPVWIDPDIEINKENLTLIANEMRKDIQQLKEGTYNKSRIIRMSDLVKTQKDEVKGQAIETRAVPTRIKAYSQEFDPSTEFSIT